MSFLYEAEDKGRFSTPEATDVYLVDLFEVPDTLAQDTVFGSLERVEELGFLPTFVKQYREEMGSSLGEMYASSPESRQTEMQDFTEKMFAHIEAGGSPADFLDEDLTCEIIVEPDEAEVWAEKWLEVLNEEVLVKPELLQVFLPYSHEWSQKVLEDLRNLKSQAQEARLYGVRLRLEACMG